MANLDVSQAPEPAQVDTPSIVGNLDTNTGPQAQPQSFGPSFNGLAQGLDQSFQIINQAEKENAYNQKQLIYARNETWALQQHSGLVNQFSQKLGDRLSSGQPYDPEEFRSDFQSAADNIANSAPNPLARAAFEIKALQSGDELFRQNLNAIAALNKAAARGAADGVMNDVVGAVASGRANPQDGIANLYSIGRTVQPIVPQAPAMVADKTSQVLGLGLQNIANTKGPAVAAVVTRSGYGGDAIPNVPRETLATQFDNAALISQEARRSVADQSMGKLMQQAAATGAVSMQDQHAAVTEQAEAHTSPPYDTNPPSLTQILQAEQEKYGALESQVGGRFPEIQLEGFKRLGAMETSKLIEQRLNVMPPDQQHMQLLELNDALGGLDKDDPFSALLRHATTMVNQNTMLLSKDTADGSRNPSYDPVTVAQRNPSVFNALDSSSNEMAAAQGNPQATGIAQGHLQTALQLSFAAQRLAGVPAGQELVLSRAEAQQYADGLNSPQDYQDLYGKMAARYGGVARADGTPANAIAVQQVFDKKGIVPAGIQLAALNPNLLENWGAASFVVPATMTKETKDAINQAIATSPDVANFAKANDSDPRWASQHADWSQGLAQFAAYQMFQHSVTNPAAAVATAYKNTIGAKYNVIPTDNAKQVLIPTDVAPTAADASGIQAKANVAMAQLQASGTPLMQRDGKTPVDDAMRWRGAVGNGYWVYDNASKALVRYQAGPQGPAPFLLSDGRPLAFTVAGLKGSNVVTPKVPTDPRFLEVMGDVLSGKQPRNVSYENGAPRLDSDLNSLIPGTAAAPIPTGASDPNAPAGAPPTPSGNAPSPFLEYIKEHPASGVNAPKGQARDDGWMQGAETTHYGYHDDPPDPATGYTLSQKGIGAFGDNPLTPGAVALSPSMEAKLQALPGDVIQMRDDQGRTRLGYFADRTSQKLTNDRIDLYDPHGSEAEGAPFTVHEYRKVGGGRADLKGRRLSAIGESNIAALEGPNG